MENQHQEKVTLLHEAEQVTITITSTSEQSAKEVLNQVSTLFNYEKN